ncbi:uncharacterized protein LOC133222863 [Neopsephotus bourkii]|uniref:uncharacterized protein LOC133222863 n=1 Tax=Neopsephotus bourkii TaxID=309878 RepID=UPI002AA55135|nr:uncharacterized protein LOC133222863 [Neopsephotus bourkii]
MEASLTCAVCLSLFEEPVTLPLCSHNFCRDCVLECLASAEASRLQQQRGQGQSRHSRVGSGAGGDVAGARVSCPLCRKLCPLPRGGAAALPVNTTLAELVRLYRSGTAGTAKVEEAEQGPGFPLSLQALGGTCQKHPGRLVQLYCRMCRQAGCGLCVSKEHQGVFHSVNLIDAVYQEEKLTFFSSLKKMRTINEKLTNEISNQLNDMDMALNKDADMIALEFREIFKTLEMKKQQLLEDVENQRSKKEKEFAIWKKMKETHKKTIENFLKDCEELVHECDPQRFLEVACGLNARMKTQLDLMNIASSYEKTPECTQKKMDINPVVNKILALKLMPVNEGTDKDLPSGGNEDSTKKTLFKNNINQWQNQKNTPNMFLPLAGQKEALADGSRICTHLMSISETSTSQNMSHEELRYKFYVEHQKLTSEVKTQTLSGNKKCKFGGTGALKARSSGTRFASSLPKANSPDKVKIGILQRADGFEKSFSGASHHSIPSTNMNSSETNGDLKLFLERSSQEAATPALESSEDLGPKEKLPMQESAVTGSNEIDTNPSNSFGLNPAASAAVTVSKSECLHVSAERPTSPFTFGACNNSVPTFIKDAGTFSFKIKDTKFVFPQFYPGKCDHADKTSIQDESKFRKHGTVARPTVSDASSSPDLDSVESEKPGFSFPFGKSVKGGSAGLGVSNSFKVLPLSPFFSQSEKPSDKNTSSHVREITLSAKETAGYGTQKPSVSGEQKANTSESATTVACNTSETNTTAAVNVTKSPILPANFVFSFKNTCFSLPSPVFSFGNTARNTSGSLTSCMFLPGNGTEEEKMNSDKTPLNVGKPVSPESVEPASRQSQSNCEDSFLPIDSSKKTESAGTLPDGSNSCSQPLSSAILPVKYENASSTQLPTATKPETKVKEEESETVAENNCSCPRKEDEPESVPCQNAACSGLGACSAPSSGGSVFMVKKTGGLPSDSDSDTELLSQTSVSTAGSGESEHSSVSEDNISGRIKSEK